MGVVTTAVGELKPNITGKRGFRPSASTRHLSDQWPISDVSSDLTIEVGATSFALHKFPLVSQSGRIRKLLLEAKDTKNCRLNLSGVPGGPEAFELAAKFCYGVNIEITLENIAMLRCAAHFLEMTEEFSEKNLAPRTEVYIKETVLPSISNSISVLHHCETLRPISEEINLVSRIISAIANNASKEQLTCGLSKLDQNFPSKSIPSMETEIPSDWWGKSLTVLSLDFFQRVLSSVKTKGLKQDMIGRILINYAHNSLQGLVTRDPQLDRENFSDIELQKKQRVIVEAIVGLLPTQSRKSTVPMAFLSSLLKSAIAASATTPCRSDLERRIGLQLDQAILEDILIPTNSFGNNHSPIYDAESILRIFSIFLNLDEDDDEDNHMRDESEMVYGFDSPRSPKQSSIIKVSKLLDNYLAEAALDSNLTPSKFIALAELLPDHARLVNDGLYRAVDIFLKVHPNVKDSESYRLCKTIDCQKLSQEACSHAAQNERLPVQMAVQVLYFEQIRLRNAMNGGHNQLYFGSLNGGQNFPQRLGSGAGSGCISPRDNYASVRRENRELKLEVARMRMRLTDLEKDHVSIKKELVPPHSAFPPFDMLPPPEVMEQKLAAQHVDMQKLATENQRLAATHGTLREELAAAQHELQMLRGHIGAFESEREQQLRSLMDRIAKMEADLQAAEPLKVELQQARTDAQELLAARQELVSKVQDLTQDLQKAHADMQQFPGLMSELENLRQEYQHCRATYDYEKQLYNDHLESLQVMEKNYITMAREVEKLRAELTNSANVDRKTGILYLLYICCLF